MLPLMHLAFSVEFKIFRCSGSLREAKCPKCPNQFEFDFKKRNSIEIKKKPLASEHLLT